MLDESTLLTDEEFDLLTTTEQESYLDIVAHDLESWGLNPRQIEAEALADQCNETLYGGAAGGGKSEWLLYRAHRLSQEIPGHTTLLLRSVFPELRRSLIRRSIVQFAADPIEIRPRWRPGDKEWIFPNGSVIECGHCESDADVGQYLSAEYDLIGFDELTEFSLYQYTMIRSRARTTRRKLRLGARPHVIAASNPGRRGHRWVKSLYVTGTDYGSRCPIRVTEPEPGEFHHVDPTNAGETDTAGPGWRTIGFLPATVLDNPHIDPAYVNHLMGLPSTLRRQYLEGDWDVFEGQYFPEFQRSCVVTDMAPGSSSRSVPLHVIEPFEIPYSWPRIRGLDWGYAAPYGCVWLAFDADGTAYAYREDYARGLTPTDQAERIKTMSISAIEGQTRLERIDYTMADPASWSKRGTGLSIAQQWSVAGLQCRQADNNRIAGWNRLREYFKVTRETDADGIVSPNVGIQIFSTCPILIRTLAELMHDRNRPEDCDTTGDDHLPDALRYALMSRPRRYRQRVLRPDLATVQGRVKDQLARFAARGKVNSKRSSTEIGSF